MGHERKRRHHLRLLSTRLPEQSRPPGIGRQLPSRLQGLRAGVDDVGRVAPAVSGEVTAKENSEFTLGNPFHTGFQFPPNEGYADAPSRFAYFGGLSSPPGLNSPVSTRDMYMSTRTNAGWVASIPGLQGKDANATARKECSNSMDLCIDHSETTEGGFEQEFAPYVFTAGGEKKGRLPTNVALIPGGKTFRGAQTMSRDFNHFVFSSNNYIEGFFGGTPHPAVVFAPGGQTDGLGSAYDNNIGDARSQLHLETPGRRTDSTRRQPDRRRKGDRLPRGLDGRDPHPDGSSREPDDR